MYDQLKLSNQFCFRIYTLSRLMTQAYRPMLEPLGLTYPQYLVMMVLWEQDNLTVSEIVHRLKLDTNTLTPLLQRMEREGLVVRTHGLVDGRQTLVSLTKKGQHLEEEAKEIPLCMEKNWNGQDYNIEELTNMVNTIDKMIGGLQ